MTEFHKWETVRERKRNEWTDEQWAVYRKAQELIAAKDVDGLAALIRDSGCAARTEPQDAEA